MPLPELEELYTLYRTDLYRYLCHLTHDPTEAEDIGWLLHYAKESTHENKKERKPCAALR